MCWNGIPEVDWKDNHPYCQCQYWNLRRKQEPTVGNYSH